MLGPPEIYQGGQLLRIPRRNTRNLLFSLACRRGMVARDELAFLFWGDKPDEIARQRLRENVSRLRSSLANPDWVLSGPDLIGLDFNAIYVDLHEFNALIDPALHLANRIPQDQPLPQPIYQKISKAVSLWRSPNCLAGSIQTESRDLEHWFTNKALQIEQLYLNLLERLSFHALAATELDLCLFYARQGLAVDESQEVFHYIILRALLSMGRFTQASAHYQNQIRHLEEEGYYFSNPQLLDLIKQLSETNPIESAQTEQQHWSVHATLKTPFIGKQLLLDQLWKRFNKGGGCLITGETGQGKTRLLEHFSSQAAPAARLLAGNCRSGEDHLELQPLKELIRSNFAERDWLAIPAPWAAQLAGLFPEILELRPELQQFYNFDKSRHSSLATQSNLFEALRQAFWTIAQSRKLLLAIDDIQWADETTLAALTYFLERPPFSELSFILLSARIEGRRPYFERLEQYFINSPRCQVLEMSGLIVDEVRSLLAYLLVTPPNETFIQKIRTDSGGNPFYILETVRSILEHSLDPTADHLETIPVPDNILHLIQQRLKDLSQPERDLLEIAAVYGNEFDPAVIQDASEYPLDEFAVFLDQLTERVLVEQVTHPSDELRYRFIHSRFREVVLSEIPELRQRWLHRQIAAALSRHPVLPYNHPAILADHYEKSSDPASAFHFWTLAAQQARREHAVTDALAHFAQAEQQLILATNITTRQVYDFYADWSKIAYETEHLELVEQIAKALLQFGYERRSDLLIGASHVTLSDAHMLQKQFREALDANYQAARYLERTGHSLAIMRLYTQRGVYLFLLERYAEADQAFHVALEQPGDDKDSRYIQSAANIHKELAMLTMFTGWPAKSIRHAKLAQEFYTTIRDPYGKVSFHSSLANAQYYLGDYSAGRMNCEAGIELAELVQAWRILGHLYSHAANLDLAMGNIDSALANARLTIQTGTERGHTEMITIGNYLIGNIFSWLRDDLQAEKFYRASLEVNKNPILLQSLTWRVGFSQALRENIRLGLDTIEQVIDTTTQHGYTLDTILSKLSKILVLYEKEQLEGIREITAQVIEDARTRELQSVNIIAMMIMSLAEFKLNSSSELDQTYLHLLNAARKLSHPLLELTIVEKFHQAAASAQINLPDQSKRVGQLLNQLDLQAQDPLIHQSFINFRDSFEFFKIKA